MKEELLLIRKNDHKLTAADVLSIVPEEENIYRLRALLVDIFPLVHKYSWDSEEYHTISKVLVALGCKIAILLEEKDPLTAEKIAGDDKELQNHIKEQDAINHKAHQTLQ